MGLNPILNLGIDEVKVRTPMSLEKMTYDAESGTVIDRSKMHLGLKRNFQVTPGAEWLESCSAATSRIATSTSFATSAGRTRAYTL